MAPEVGSLWVEKSPMFTTGKATIYKVEATGPSYLVYCISHDPSDRTEGLPQIDSPGVIANIRLFLRRHRPFQP